MPKVTVTPKLVKHVALIIEEIRNDERITNVHTAAQRCADKYEWSASEIEPAVSYAGKLILYAGIHKETSKLGMAYNDLLRRQRRNNNTTNKIKSRKRARQ